MSVIEEYVEQNRQRFLEELRHFLEIPSISALPDHREDIWRAARWLAEEMQRIGLQEVQVLPTGGNPVVYGQWLGAPGKPTALVYGHYDVQPVDPLDEWETPPFEPAVRDGDVFARGAADDKGQVFVHLKAAEALLRESGRLPVNLKFLIEGEEEVGSEHLDAFIAERQELLRADLAVVSDTSMFQRGMPSICYGLRGIAYWQVDVVGPRSDLHSGTYGGAVHNPIQVLVEMLASLKDPEQRITIPGFYDRVRPLSPEEREQFARLPFDEEAYKAELGVRTLVGEAGYTVLERLWARPTLEINGIWGGFTGEGPKTVIPARAHAKVSCRLVPDQDPYEVDRLFQDHIRRIAPPSVDVQVRLLSTGKPSLTPLDHPAVQAAARALERGFGKQPVFIRGGGSIPVVATLQEVLKVPTVLVGLGTPDEHAHAPNERFPLENFYGGILSIAALWEELAH